MITKARFINLSQVFGVILNKFILEYLVLLKINVFIQLNLNKFILEFDSIEHKENIHDTFNIPVKCNRKHINRCLLKRLLKQIVIKLNTDFKFLKN